MKIEISWNKYVLILCLLIFSSIILNDYFYKKAIFWHIENEWGKERKGNYYKYIKEVEDIYRDVSGFLEEKIKSWSLRNGNPESVIIKQSKDAIKKDEKEMIITKLSRAEELYPDNGFINYINAKYYLYMETGGGLSWIKNLSNSGKEHYAAWLKCSDYYNYERAYKEIIKGNIKKEFNSFAGVHGFGLLGLADTAKCVAVLGKKYEKSGKKEEAVKCYKEVYKMGDNLVKENKLILNIMVGYIIRSISSEIMEEYALKYNDIKLLNMINNDKLERTDMRFAVSRATEKYMRFTRNLSIIMIATKILSVLCFILLFVSLINVCFIKNRNSAVIKYSVKISVIVFFIFIISYVISYHKCIKLGNFVKNIVKYGEMYAVGNLIQ